MGKTAIIADTLACLPSELVEQYGIEILGPNIYFDGKVYRDGVDITPSEANEMLDKAPDLFSTATPPPTEFVEAFHRVSQWADNILCITISSKLTTFYNVATLAKEQAKAELPNINIEVMDSETVTGAEGFVVLGAARAAAEGKDFAGIIEAAQKIKDNVSLTFVLESIRHAYRTGRIPKVASQLGSLLSVKPILTIRDGKAHLTGMTRSKKKGVNSLLETMHKKVGDKAVHVAVHHTSVPEEGEQLKQRVMDEFNCAEIWLTEFSPVMSYSTGRGTLGLAFYAED